MLDLEERFDSLELLEPPEQWLEIERRARVAEQITPSPTWTPARVAVVAVIVTLAFFSGVVLLRGPDVEPQEVVTNNVATTLTPTTPTSVPTTVAPPETTPLPPPVPGMAWQRVIDDSLSPGVIRSVTLGGPGLVAIGQPAAGVEGGVVWVSADGRRWDRIDDPEVFDGPGVQLIYWVVAGPSGLVIGGHDDRNAALWHSPDGYEWSKVLVDDLGTPDDDDELAVFAGGPGLVAIETDDSPGDYVFVSEDGITWTRSDDPALVAQVVLAYEQPEEVELPRQGEDDDVAVNDDVIVSVRWDTNISIWASIDSGETWQQTDLDDPAFPSAAHTSEVIAFGNGFVVVGSAGDDDAGIWFGEWIGGDSE